MTNKNKKKKTKRQKRQRPEREVKIDLRAVSHSCKVFTLHLFLLKCHFQIKQFFFLKTYHDLYKKIFKDDIPETHYSSGVLHLLLLNLVIHTTQGQKVIGYDGMYTFCIHSQYFWCLLCDIWLHAGISHLSYRDLKSAKQSHKERTQNGGKCVSLLISTNSTNKPLNREKWSCKFTSERKG